MISAEKTGFSRLNYSAEEAVFKARWEAAVFTLVQAIGRAGVYTNIDQFRHAVERIDPEAYLNHGYYGRWLGAIETLLVEARVLTTDEITQQALALGARDTDLIAAQPSHDQSSVSGYAADSSGTTENALFGVADRVSYSRAWSFGAYSTACLCSWQIRGDYSLPRSLALPRFARARRCTVTATPLYRYL